MINLLVPVAGTLLTQLEDAVVNAVITDLAALKQPEDRAQCDTIFGKFTHDYLLPCVNSSFASRAAEFSSKRLIPAVLALEKQRNVKFHKGALFHDTAIAASLAGNEDLFDYLLAMTDEEEVRTTIGGHKRGTFNLQNGGMAAQALAKRLQFACDLLNGTVLPGGVDYALVTGNAAITATQLDQWRLQQLDAGHQFELWRVLHELHVFGPLRFAEHSESGDNPFVLLRLAKALGHLAQFVESCFTGWPGGVGKTLSKKFQQDPSFGATMSAAAGTPDQFAGNNPTTAGGLNTELTQLVHDIVAQSAVQRQWRVLRVLYLVRNSTAHTIDTNLLYYSNRALTVELTQTVFASLFLLCQLRGRSIP